MIPATNSCRPLSRSEPRMRGDDPCDTDSARQDLIDAFRREGIDEVNGVPIEKFVKVKEVVGT